MKLDVLQRLIGIYIYYKFHEIRFRVIEFFFSQRNFSFFFFFFGGGEGAGEGGEVLK